MEVLRGGIFYQRKQQSYLTYNFIFLVGGNSNYVFLIFTPTKGVPMIQLGPLGDPTRDWRFQSCRLDEAPTTGSPVDRSRAEGETEHLFVDEKTMGDKFENKNTVFFLGCFFAWADLGCF